MRFCKHDLDLDLILFCFRAVLVALENMGFIANMVSMVIYFNRVMYFDIPSSANTLTNFMGAIFLLSLLGGFISDTFLSRLTTCLIFGFLEVLVRTNFWHHF